MCLERIQDFLWEKQNEDSCGYEGNTCSHIQSKSFSPCLLHMTRLIDYVSIVILYWRRKNIKVFFIFSSVCLTYCYCVVWKDSGFMDETNNDFFIISYSGASNSRGSNHQMMLFPASKALTILFLFIRARKYIW